MQSLAVRPYGWDFLITLADGSARHYGLDELDHAFDLGLKGATVEVSRLARVIAERHDAHVQAWFNGRVLASAAPPAR
jgi:hypothetical protein